SWGHWTGVYGAAEANLKVQVFTVLVLPVLLYGCETWTLTSDLRQQLDVFGIWSLWRILGYRWFDFVLNERLLREARMRPITSIVRERQLRHYGHVAYFSEDDPECRCLIAEDPSDWTRSRGHPRNTWLRQMDGWGWTAGLPGWLPIRTWGVFIAWWMPLCTCS
ncbi:hypothetical protein LDENG_00080410, partial [Lucifuga dentata]